MTKNLFKILAVFIIGVCGGIFADQILWPYFIERPLFYRYRLEQSPVYVTEKKEITSYVQENVALRESIERVEKAVAGVRTRTVEGKILEGSGLIVTSDGLIVTLADLIPQGSAFYFYVEGKWPAYQILKRDLENNLALVKVEDGRFSATGFADLGKIKLGERVFFVARDFSLPATGTLPVVSSTVNEGIISAIGKDSVQTNISEKPTVSGSPLFNIEGKVIGLNIVDEAGKVSAIPVTAIRQFIGF